MKSDSLRILKVFSSGGDIHYVLPHFQREYTWEKTHWQTLLADAVAIYEEMQPDPGIDEFPPPSLQAVAKRLGCSRGFLRQNFPERASIIVERHTKFRKTFVDPEGVRAQLQILQTEIPPLSINKCAERLGCTYVHLFEYFPDICRVIGARYAHFNRENARQRRELRRQAIIKAKMDIEADRIPATRYQIRKRLPHIKNLTILEIDAALNGRKDNYK